MRQTEDMNLLRKKPTGFVLKTALMLLFTIASLAQAVAQEKRVELSSRTITLEQAFKQIEQQTGVIVAVNHTALDVNQKVTIATTSGSASEILTALLVNTGQTYELKDNYAILRKAEVHSDPILAKQSIFGYVQALDKSVGLNRAKIILNGPLSAETFSDELGKYSFIDIPAGTYTVSTSYLKYEQQQIAQVVKKSENVRVMFLLNPIHEQESQIWSTSFVYPEYDTEFQLPDHTIAHYIAPYQKQRLPLFALKTNLLYYGALMTNIGVEIRLSNSLTIDLPVVYKPFEINNAKQFRLLSVQPELRYWLRESFNGHFFGGHLSYTQFSIGNRKLPFGIYPEIEDNRYEGDQYSVGVSYGYQTMLNKRLGLEFSFGVGYAYADYKRYDCDYCSKYVDKGSKYYFGPTNAGVTLVYIIK